MSLKKACAFVVIDLFVQIDDIDFIELGIAIISESIASNESNYYAFVIDSYLID